MKPLRFVHIPKTGGTSIEHILLTHGVKWGMYDPDFRVAKWKSIRESEKVWFHYPLYLVENQSLYEEWISNYDFFCVVRNPYDRCVSEFFCPHFRHISRSSTASVEDFNRTIQEYVQSKFTSSHWAPQSLFVYYHDHEKRGEQIIKHVLRFENLQTEFNQLMID